jgi:hypothetical protein
VLAQRSPLLSLLVPGKETHWSKGKPAALYAVTKPLSYTTVGYTVTLDDAFAEY